MVSKYLSALLVVAATTVFAQAPPSWKQEWAPTGLNILNTGTNGGLNGLPHSSYTKTKWAYGTLPRGCYNEAMSGKCDPYQMEVYDIQYEDCSHHVDVMCRCSNAQVSIDQLATDFGKVPPKARQWVKYVSAYADTSCHAGSGDNRLNIYGNCNNAVSVYFHEVAHSLDSWVLGTNGNGAWSLGSTWTNLYTSDWCVADNYAKASNPESWAQAAVMAAYHGNVDNIFNYNPSPACMNGQLTKAIDQVITTPFFKRTAGQTCDREWTKDESVCMGPVARDAGHCDSLVSKRSEKRFVA